jgi:hypothetical protein
VVVFAASFTSFVSEAATLSWLSPWLPDWPPDWLASRLLPGPPDWFAARLPDPDIPSPSEGCNGALV